MLLRELKSGAIRSAIVKMNDSATFDNVLDLIDLIRQWVVDGLRYYCNQGEIKDEETKPKEIPE